MRPGNGEPKMTASPIRFALTEAAIVELMDAITATTARRIASEPDAPYAALERRWRQIGGMLELARRLDAWRLVRALEAHKDDLRRQMEILSRGFTP
jgi:hypothetical protein